MEGFIDGAMDGESDGLTDAFIDGLMDGVTVTILFPTDENNVGDAEGILLSVISRYRSQNEENSSIIFSNSLSIISMPWLLLSG